MSNDDNELMMMVYGEEEKEKGWVVVVLGVSVWEEWESYWLPCLGVGLYKKLWSDGGLREKKGGVGEENKWVEDKFWFLTLSPR
jgi:hypothetical protein